jgi:hypothetical protein
MHQYTFIDEGRNSYMRKRLSTIVLGGSVAALAITLSATTAQAASGWKVSPGGSFSSKGSDQVTDSKTGTVAKCTTVKISGTLKKSASSGKGLGTIKKASFSGCTIGPIAVTVATHGLPWKLNATSYSNGVVTGSVSGIDLVATATGCSATLDGTGAGKDNGVADATYTNKTGVLALTGNGNLHDYAVSGCAGLVNNGDPEKASGTNTVKPKQTITGP